MHRSVWSRVFAAFVAIWFTVNMVEPAWLHACPVHGGLAIAAAHDGANSGSTHHSSHHDQSDSKGAGHLCQCLGACTTAAMISSPPSAHIETIEVRASAPGLGDHDFFLAERAHELPFSNGPPA
jgi:hypothetical protein